MGGARKPPEELCSPLASGSPGHKPKNPLCFWGMFPFKLNFTASGSPNPASSQRGSGFTVPQKCPGLEAGEGPFRQRQTFFYSLGYLFQSWVLRLGTRSQWAERSHGTEGGLGLQNSRSVESLMGHLGWL